MTKTNYPESNEILFLRGDINYTEFHLVNGRKVVSSFTLLRYEEKFEGFVRVITTWYNLRNIFHL